MNRKDLEAKYHIFGENKDITLYDKARSENGVGYRGNISLKNGKAVFEGKAYTDIEALDTALREWENGLEWPVDTYNPMFNERYRLEARIIWYLENKMGFKHTYEGFTSVYVKTIGPAFSLKFEITNKNDEINLYTRYGTVSFYQKIENEQKAIDLISSIVKASVLLMAKDLVEALSLCPADINADIDSFIDSRRSILGFEKINFKELMIDELERQLKVLKNA